ncbi:MAG: 2-hydroxymuconic semialdehyde dehydrogenase [Myxococcota bacterium]|jgi:aminomuconate-semialdehyde/2-hydroxymuconate-6-semialdehyde dehydrogenase|nr:2-hydroxymuconic semialdehyde dehydrogenase [Myxococcota bacterium]
MTRHYPLFIDGAFCEGENALRFDDINPATGHIIATVSEASKSDVDRAVAAAQKAFKGPWRKLTMNARLDLLSKASQRIMERFDQFLEYEMDDTGKPVSFASKIDIPRGAANLQLFADLARSMGTESYTTETPDGGKAINYAQRDPLGVIGVICPWNLPLLLMTWKVGPALAAGNTVVVKPSEETPASATLLAEVFQEVGLPAGVFNVVHGFGVGSAGEALTEHPDVAAITFTGESATGKAIMRTVADSLKPISFELGGKNAAIVFPDCDLDKAIEGTLRSVFSNCGQVCLCSERVYVHRSIFEPFLERLKAGAEAIRIGDPHDQATVMGPLISAHHKEKVMDYFRLAREEGATVVTGGGEPSLEEPFQGGHFVQPTLWTGLNENARCVREEIFGPVAHVQPFDHEDDVIRMANDSPYGLCAAIWTEDLSRAHRVADQLEVGMVWVNSWFLRDLRTPFGGTGASGIGREGGKHSIEFYSDLKNICIKL